jgi:hypothetical protein
MLENKNPLVKLSLQLTYSVNILCLVYKEVIINIPRLYSTDNRPLCYDPYFLMYEIHFFNMEN